QRDPRRDHRGARPWRSGRVARLRRLLGQEPPGPHRPQSADRRAGRGDAEERPILQDRQGDARAAEQLTARAGSGAAMRRFLFLVLLVPLAIVIVVLSVANRHDATLSLDPFSAGGPVLSLTAPLYVLLFAALLVGVVVGGIATWLRQGRWRRMARSERLEAARLRRER